MGNLCTKKGYTRHPTHLCEDSRHDSHSSSISSQLIIAGPFHTTRQFNAHFHPSASHTTDYPSSYQSSKNLILPHLGRLLGCEKLDKLGQFLTGGVFELTRR